MCPHGPHLIQRGKRREEWEARDTGGGEKYDKRTEETETEDTGDEETTWTPSEDGKRRVWAEREGRLEVADSNPTSATNSEAKRKGDGESN